MKPNQFFYCILEGQFVGEKSGTLTITFAPIEYWDKRKALPDYCFSDQISNTWIPLDFFWIYDREECMWITTQKFSHNFVRKIMDGIGFVYSKEMEDFLMNLADDYK